MKKIISVFKYILLSAISFISIFPFLWMIISATNQSVDIMKGSLLPGTYLLQNLKHLFYNGSEFSGAFLNSTEISVMITILSLIICSMAGYGFQIYRSKSKDIVFKILLLSMMVPFASLMVPLFIMFSHFKGLGFGLNTHASVIILGLSSAFLIFFFRQNTKSFPVDILEAGRIDGLSELQIFIRIFMPTMKSTYAAAAIITFMGSWNSYMWPLITLSTASKRTLPLVIATMNSSYNADYGLMMTAIVIAILPTALLFFLMQKQFIEGMLGSIKG